jgi:hypothetical protein
MSLSGQAEFEYHNIQLPQDGPLATGFRTARAFSGQSGSKGPGRNGCVAKQKPKRQKAPSEAAARSSSTGMVKM